MLDIGLYAWSYSIIPLFLSKRDVPHSHSSAYVEVIADEQPVLREG